MIRIKVPATSANLGPGFDVLGLALSLYNVITFTEKDGAMGHDTMVHVAYHKVFEHLGRKIVPVEIEIEAEIPMARGLGSSSACIVGGLMGANEMLGSPLSTQELLALATELEGHPDNVTPALYGGLMASLTKEGRVHSLNIPVKNRYSFIALIPDFALSTEKARAVLPEVLSYEDSVHNVSRTTMLLTALLTGQDDLLSLGMEDRMHQPYRGKLIPGFERIGQVLYDCGVLGFYLSGAGPSIMGLTREDDQEVIEKIRTFMTDELPGWQVLVLHLEEKGAMRIG